METSYKNSQKESFNKDLWVAKPWEKIHEVTKYGRIKDTGISINDILEISNKVNVVPDTLTANSIVKKIYENRKVSVEKGKGIDFATAESLAFGSLLMEGFSIRLSG